MAILYPYIQYLEECNPFLEGMQSFVFYPGMAFGSREKWWPDTGERPTRHEGVDFCYYLDASGKEHRVPNDLRVPVAGHGRIAAISKDYLGYSLFLDHQYSQTLRFLSVYAHIIPDSGLEVGKYLVPGEVVGTIADTTGRKNRMPAHLHLSFMGVERDVSADLFNWDLINKSLRSELFDPLRMIETEKIDYRSVNHWKEKGLASSK